MRQPRSGTQAVHHPWNAITSRKCCSPQIHATVRSSPSPNPECVNVPYFRSSRYQPVRFHGKPFVLDALHQTIVVVLALRPADDLAVSLGRQTVVAQHRARIVRVLLHVERLGFLGIVDPRTRAGRKSSTSNASSSAPRSSPHFHLASLALQRRYRVAVVDARERAASPAPARDVALQHLQLRLPALQRPRDEERDEVLLQLMLSSESFHATSGSHIQNSVRCRRVFDFSARNVGPKHVDLAERRSPGLAVQLARLREVRRPSPKYSVSNSPRFPDGPRQDGRVEPHESTLVEEVVDRLLHFVAYPRDGPLPADRSHRCRWSSRNSMPCSFGWIGYSVGLAPTTPGR